MTGADRLVEPCGLLHGSTAAGAIASGQALRLAGGAIGFTSCLLIEAGQRSLVRVDAIPDDWSEAVGRVVASPPDAGLPEGPLVIGILNATPDSFSDGGAYPTVQAAIDAGVRMREQGAALIDVGGESTRPGAVPVDPAEEQDRILPIVQGLIAHGITVSVDTRNAVTMQAALRSGARLVNDVSGFSYDPQSRSVVADARCPAVLMHMRGTPQTMSGLVDYDDVATSVVQALRVAIGQAVSSGIDRNRLLVDPGIGFAKTEAQSLELLARLPLLANLGCRVMLGVSRKGFIGRIGGEQRAVGRLAGSIVAAMPGLALGGTLLRVHDVAETVQAVRLWQAIHG
jgi:dihydropteroate synthase